MFKKKSTLIIALLLPVQIVLIQFLKHYPAFIEKWYSLGLYPWIGKIARSLWGWVPFSVGDVFYTLIFIVVLRWIYKNFKGWNCSTKGIKKFDDLPDNAKNYIKPCSIGEFSFWVSIEMAG